MQLSQKAVERASEVFRRARLHDTRLERRAVALAEALAETPHLSVPQMWTTSGALQAGYDFLRNPKCAFTALMAAGQQATYEAALEEACVLILHDTTDVMCPAADADEVGYLPTGKAGFFVHHALCIKPNPNPTRSRVVRRVGTTSAQHGSWSQRFRD